MWKSILRALFLASAVYFYFTDREILNYRAIFERGFNAAFLWVVWLVLVIEMLSRIIPNRQIAIGARKHFACSYRAADPIGTNAAEISAKSENMHKGAFKSALFWFAVSAFIIFVLFILGMLTPGAIILFTLIYAVADLFFIMVFCPLRVLFMRNQCCVTCRIYNWDYFMICAPMVVFPGFYSISLIVLSLIVILRWELSLQKNPHFFTGKTNASLRCDMCKDKLCPKW